MSFAFGRACARLQRRQRLALLLAGVCLPFIAAAAEPVAAEPVTSDALVEAVLEANPNLAALQAAVAEAQARIAPAGALDDPMLSYLGAPRSVGSRIGTRHVVRISQVIPWPGTRALRASVAKAQAGAASQRLAAYRLEVAAAVRTLFAEWFYVHHGIRINRRSQTLLSELKQSARTRYTAGRSGQQDVLQAEVELQMLRREALALQREARGARAQINALLNRRADSDLGAPAGADSDSAVLPAAEPAEHPELGQLQAAMLASEQRIALTQKAFFPDLQLTAQWNSLWDLEEKRWVAGVALNLPLDRDKRRARLDGARAERQRLEWQLAERRAQLDAQREDARAAAAEAKQSIALYTEQLLPLARENLAAARSDYRAGGGAFINVIIAERQLLATEHDLARAHADRLRARAQLARWTAADPIVDQH